MAPSQASGAFDHDGWRLHQPGDDPRGAQFASAHESHHKQLQDSTSHGALARIYHELAVADGDPAYRAIASSLTAASRSVQEAFASWLPAAALGWTRTELTRHYPEYQRHFDALDELVRDVESPYLRFHAAHAICRAAMQTSIIESALASGLDQFTLAHIRNRDLPDSRFAALRRHRPSWEEAILSLTALADSDRRMAGLIEAPTLIASLFDTGLDDVWQEVNQTLYDTVSAALAACGATTLPLDGHLAQTPMLVKAARQIRDELAIEAGHRRERSEASAIVLGNVESETFSTSGPLRARLIESGTNPALLSADLDNPHLFVTLRRTETLLPNYEFPPGAKLPEAGAAAFLRRTVIDDDGLRTVELLPLGQPDELSDTASLPVVFVTPMSLLSEPSLAAWNQDAGARRLVLLGDLPLAAHIELWLAKPRARFQYAFLRTESFGRVVPFMIGMVSDLETEAIWLMARPLSHAGVRIHKAALEEMAPAMGAMAEDGSFIEENNELIRWCLAHLAGEEVVFGPFNKGHWIHG